LVISLFAVLVSACQTIDLSTVKSARVRRQVDLQGMARNDRGSFFVRSEECAKWF
jgi:hypothetical protein